MASSFWYYFGSQKPKAVGDGININQIKGMSSIAVDVVPEKGPWEAGDGEGAAKQRVSELWVRAGLVRFISRNSGHEHMGFGMDVRVDLCVADGDYRRSNRWFYTCFVGLDDLCKFVHELNDRQIWFWGETIWFCSLTLLYNCRCRYVDLCWVELPVLSFTQLALIAKRRLTSAGSWSALNQDV